MMAVSLNYKFNLNIVMSFIKKTITKNVRETTDFNKLTLKDIIKFWYR